MGTISTLNLSTLTPTLKPTLVEDEAGLSVVADFLSRVDTFGLDLETNVTDSFIERKIRTIQIGNRDEQYVIDLLAFAGSHGRLLEQGGMVAPAWAAKVVAVLEPALDSDKYLKVGYNLQFEYETLLWCLGVYTWGLYDCLLAEKAIYAGAVDFMAQDFWGMDDTVLRYFGCAVDKTLQTSFNLEVRDLTPDQIAYAALDTRLPLALMNAQTVVLKKDGLLEVCKIENDAIPAFGDMHLHGIRLDTKRWSALAEKNKEIHADNIKKLDKFFIPIVGRKGHSDVDLESLEQAWRDEPDKEKRKCYRKAYQDIKRAAKSNDDALLSYEGEAAINYGSTKQLIKALRSVGFGPKKLPNTNNRTLTKLESHPIIKALIDYRFSKITLTTFGDAFVEKYVNDVTGRVHPNISQFGAATGRTTSRNPNSQNIPRTQEYRRCFVAEAGYSLITADQSGAELRILAELSGEPVWIEAFNKGWDVHSVGAEMLFGERWASAALDGCAYVAKHKKCKCPGHVKLRDQIKSINFGIAYGMEAQKLSEQLGISRDEAAALLVQYRGTFKRVTAYLQESGNSAKYRLACRTVAGRRRLFIKPNMDSAKRIAVKRAVDDGRTALDVTQRDVIKAYNGMLASIEREGKNTPIQGSNADVIKKGIGCGFSEDGSPYLWHRVRAAKARFVNCVHDEVVIEAKDEIAKVVESDTVDCLVRAGASLIKSVVMEVESCVGKEWSKG